MGSRPPRTRGQSLSDSDPASPKMAEATEPHDGTRKKEAASKGEAQEKDNTSS